MDSCKPRQKASNMQLSTRGQLQNTAKRQVQCNMARAYRWKTRRKASKMQFCARALSLFRLVLLCLAAPARLRKERTVDAEKARWVQFKRPSILHFDQIPFRAALGVAEGDLGGKVGDQMEGLQVAVKLLQAGHRHPGQLFDDVAHGDVIGQSHLLAHSWKKSTIYLCTIPCQHFWFLFSTLCEI